MEVNLNNKSWLATFYKYTYGELTYNLCNFFWGTIYAIVWLPITWPTYPLGYVFNIKSYTCKLWGRILLGILTYIIANLLFLWILSFFYFPEKAWFALWIILSALGCIAVLFIVISTSIIVRESDTWELTGSYFKAVKKGICPQITWKNK